MREQILAKSLQELIRVGIIESEEVQNLKADGCADIVKSMKTDLTLEDNSPSGLFHSCSVLSEGMTCRSLKKLPFLAYVLIAPNCSLPVSYISFLKALRDSIDKTNQEREMVES